MQSEEILAGGDIQSLPPLWEKPDRPRPVRVHFFKFHRAVRVQVPRPLPFSPLEVENAELRGRADGEPQRDPAASVP
eukprot:gene13167-biopygen17004